MHYKDTTNSVKAIIFDVDGVIIRSMDSAGRFLWSQNIERDLGITGVSLKNIFSSGWEDVIKGKVDTRKFFENGLLEQGNNKTSVDEFISYWLSQDSNLDTPVLDIVQRLERPAYLGTNQDSYRSKHLNGLVGYLFDGMFTSWEIGAAKPESAFFEHIENALKLSPKELMLIDDRAENIESAASREWTVHHFTGDINALKQALDVQ